MDPLRLANPNTFETVRFVLTDMDETLTFRGRLGARTYAALERLQAAGVKVIPVTAAPAGWCDQMARMWPVDGVIGENGGLFFQRSGEERGLVRTFWHAEDKRQGVTDRLNEIAASVQQSIPDAVFAEDQPFRLTSVAFARSSDPALTAAIMEALHVAGANTTQNNLWILGWLGPYDKLAMTRRVLSTQHDVDIDGFRDVVLYVGDSLNDAPMFGHFSLSVGMSTIVEELPLIPTPPRWVTTGPGGDGFVEVADAVLRAKSENALSSAPLTEGRH
ncbi:HAD-IIB family hydrolase [Bradyrhizobium liaoningense]